jgi:hypothetical protein
MTTEKKVFGRTVCEMRSQPGASPFVILPPRAKAQPPIRLGFVRRTEKRTVHKPCQYERDSGHLD